MSATGTPTPNIGLRRPQGTDPASVDDINYNSALLDTKLGAVGNTSLQDQIDTLSTNTAQNLGKVQDGLAIVANGNTHVAIPADYFVYVKGHNSLSEGLYKNTSGSTIAANATLSTSNLTADDNGGLNSVYDALNSKLNSYIYAVNATVNLGNIPVNNYKDGYVDIDTAQGYNHLLLIPQYTSIGMPVAGTYVGTGAADGKTRIVVGMNNTKNEVLSNVTATVRVVFYL